MVIKLFLSKVLLSPVSRWLFSSVFTSATSLLGFLKHIGALWWIQRKTLDEGAESRSKGEAQQLSHSQDEVDNTPGLALPYDHDMVSWTLSGTYDLEKPILIDAADPRRFVTKRKAVDLITKLTEAFDEGSTVCLHLANDVSYPVLVMAIYASRCRWTGTNIAYTAAELEHHFRVSKTKYVVTAAEHLNVVQRAAQESGSDPEIVLFTDLLDDTAESWRDTSAKEKNHGLRTLHDLLWDGTTETLLRALRRVDPTSIAAIFSTSGTTGLPKMAVRTHKAMVLETRAIEDNNAEKDYEVRRLYCTPIFHGFSAPEMICNSLRLGQTTFIMKRFDDFLFPQYVNEYNITETSAPPPMLLRLVRNEAAHRQIQSLRTVFTGGAPLAPELGHKFHALFEKPSRIAQVWGMTEGGWFTTYKYPEEDINGSVGRVIPGCQIRIRDENKTQLTDGTHAGEIQVQGSFLMEGYLGNEDATRQAFCQGWLRTGDIGYVKDGRVYLVDRAKDLIKVNGWQVAPAEIEDALLKNDDVEDAGVVGSGHGIYEHPLAFVVRKHAGVTADSIKGHLLERLTRYKVAQCEVCFVDSIPKSASGKILKKDLRKLINVPSGDRFLN